MAELLIKIEGKCGFGKLFFNFGQVEIENAVERQMEQALGSWTREQGL